jgi:hypothetical protein
MNRIAAYALGTAIASLVYIAWTAVDFLPPGGLGFRLGLALFFWLVEGFSVTLLLVGIPWILVVRLYRGSWRAGWAYFAVIGAVLTFAIGCAATSLSPKPLFIEDQTFFEGARIAAEREGLCFTVAGILLGFTYWLFAEKRPSSAPKGKASPGS